MTEQLTATQYQQLSRAERHGRISEDAVQAGIVNYCRRVLPRPWEVFAVPNKTPRGKSGKAVSGCPGFKPGVSDLILIGPNRQAIFAEVKRPKTAEQSAGKLTIEQVAFLAAMRACGFVGCTWYSIDDARNTFKALGIETREVVS